MEKFLGTTIERCVASDGTEEKVSVEEAKDMAQEESDMEEEDEQLSEEEGMEDAEGVLLEDYDEEDSVDEEEDLHEVMAREIRSNPRATSKSTKSEGTSSATLTKTRKTSNK